VVLLPFKQADGLGGVLQQRDGVGVGAAVEDGFGNHGHRAMGDQVAVRTVQFEFPGVDHRRASIAAREGRC
jgi:hypothetical protein